MTIGASSARFGIMGPCQRPRRVTGERTLPEVRTVPTAVGDVADERLGTRSGRRGVEDRAIGGGRLRQPAGRSVAVTSSSPSVRGCTRSRRRAGRTGADRRRREIDRARGVAAVRIAPVQVSMAIVNAPRPGDGDRERPTFLVGIVGSDVGEGHDAGRRGVDLGLHHAEVGRVRRADQRGAELPGEHVVVRAGVGHRVPRLGRVEVRRLGGEGDEAAGVRERREAARVVGGPPFDGRRLHRLHPRGPVPHEHVAPARSHRTSRAPLSPPHIAGRLPASVTADGSAAPEDRCGRVVVRASFRRGSRRGSGDVGGGNARPCRRPSVVTNAWSRRPQLDERDHPPVVEIVGVGHRSPRIGVVPRGRGALVVETPSPPLAIVDRTSGRCTRATLPVVGVRYRRRSVGRSDEGPSPRSRPAASPGRALDDEIRPPGCANRRTPPGRVTRAASRRSGRTVCEPPRVGTWVMTPPATPSEMAKPDSSSSSSLYRSRYSGVPNPPGVRRHAGHGRPTGAVYPSANGPVERVSQSGFRSTPKASSGPPRHVAVGSALRNATYRRPEMAACELRREQMLGRLVVKHHSIYTMVDGRAGCAHVTSRSSRCRAERGRWSRPTTGPGRGRRVEPVSNTTKRPSSETASRCHWCSYGSTARRRLLGDRHPPVGRGRRWRRTVRCKRASRSRRARRRSPATLRRAGYRSP